MSTDLNIRAKAVRHLEENRTISLWSWVGQSFLNNDTKITSNKENKLDFIKIKNFSCKSHHQKSDVITQPKELEKLFVDHISDKEFVFKI